MTSFSFGTIKYNILFSVVYFLIYISIHNKRITFKLVGDRYRDYLIFITSALIICN